MDGWNTFSFPFGGFGLFSGVFAVSFREGKMTISYWTWQAVQALQAQDLLKAALEKPETREVAKKAAP